MLVYREDRRAVSTAAALRALIARQHTAECGTPEDALAVLVAAGELEAAICDSLFGGGDRPDPRSDALRSLSLAAARQYLAALAGDRAETRICAIADALLYDELPAEVELRTSEGYAYYALFPETYAESARRFARDLKPRRVCVIGVRSIGTSLSAVAAAALQPIADVTSCTVRPRGHPFDRRLQLDPALRDVWRGELQRDASFAIVDEGPGLSGSSFASVVSALESIDVPCDRIVLLPSWDPAPERLRSSAARRIWARHRRYVTSAVECGITPERAFGVDGSSVDWSGGRWREHVVRDTSCWPAAQPQHERWKVHVPGERRLLKFCGLGDYGSAAADRARRMSSIGCARAGGVRHGFMELTFVDGRPAAAPFSTHDADIVGRYIGTRSAEFGFEHLTDAAALVEMIVTNVHELLDEDVSPAARDRLTALFARAPAGQIDGRALAHEWIRAGDGLVKVAALDHASDHFFPGPQNPAWDLAAATLELELDDRATRRMIHTYERASGDRECSGRMPAYLLAYAAFRAAYASLAKDALNGTADAERFDGVLATYRGHVRRLIPSVL